MNKKRLLPSAVAALVFTTGTALACAPAPSCWLEPWSGRDAYVLSVCRGYAKDHQTLKQIAQNLDEPEKIGAFAKACERLHIHLRAK
jgi:hypothetical protein